MSKKNNFKPTEPFVPKKHRSEPAPRGARRMARILLIILAVLLVALIVVTVKTSALNRAPEATPATEELAAPDPEPPPEDSAEPKTASASTEATDEPEASHETGDANYDGQVDVDDLSDSAVLAYLNNYLCDDETVDLDRFLLDCGYLPIGAHREYVYVKDDLRISIQCDIDGDMVTVGDAQGTSREYGRPHADAPDNLVPFYLCHVSWTQSYGEAREVTEESGDDYELFTSETLAHIVRLAFR